MQKHGDNGRTLSEALGISEQRFSKKINGTDDAEFTQHEIKIIKARYKLSAKEVDSIFFNLKVS